MDWKAVTTTNVRGKICVFENFVLIVVSSLNAEKNQLIDLSESLGNLSHLRQ